MICDFCLFLTRSMSMFCAGGITSMGSTFGFLRGRLWGLGRLWAPPIIWVEPHEHRHINTTSANMHRHTAAILAVKSQSSSGGLFRFLSSYFSKLFSSFCIELSVPSVSVCSLLFLICFIHPQTHTQNKCINRRGARDKPCENRGWSIKLSINLVCWQKWGQTAVLG